MEITQEQRDEPKNVTLQMVFTFIEAIQKVDLTMPIEPNTIIDIFKTTLDIDIKIPGVR